ncbi:ABC transporter permease [Phosphitispora fastidiosa]|uniref:ABC transporter permease n=1 Tax=Phosphitispora fastidiosa TaxID=2837202 RepID=UPI001E398DC5|nr:ABC transporter permease [Phosphitispora fastidiosa]MBU7006042.1 putative ABC transport system permease protein [Phosphitispora fastidiosa]
MKSYLSIVPRYLSAHKKRTRLTMISVAVSVALITGVFSMLDVFMRFEKIQVIHDFGNYHLLVKDADNEEAAAIRSRIDVENAGNWAALGKGSIDDVTCSLGALDKNFAENMNIRVVEGDFPTGPNEIMLEQWAMEGLNRDLKINGTVEISLADNVKREFIISGIYQDLGSTKARGVPGIFLSVAAAGEMFPEVQRFFLIQFKDGVNIIEAEKEIKETLNIAEGRIDRNDRLLAVIGQSKHKAAIGLYTIGAILFGIVLAAGVVMMYNTFNISVMERVRQFGLLRCIGASQAQIKRLVRRESLYITLKAVPIGVLGGMLITFVCSAILKFYNSSLFGEMPLFSVSITGISAGIVIGFLTVFIASLLPARKAARVSPINAVTGSNDMKISKSRKRGLLTRWFRAEIGIGINNAIIKKKTLFLMSCSIAISIVMFLGFQVFVDFLHSSLKTTKPYTPDVSLRAEQGIGSDVYDRLSGLAGIKKVYGRMFGYVDATFDASRLSDTYRETLPRVQVADNGLLEAPEKSWLISYDKSQLNWAKEDLIAGEVSEDKINAKNGIIAVAFNTRNGVQSGSVNFKPGDKVYIKTPAGKRVFIVQGILRSVPFSDAELNLATFITTEKLFKELTGESSYEVIDIQLNERGQEQTISEIKGIAGSAAAFLDARQKNAEMDQTFFTMAVFVYGFVAVIGFISVLNIVNTMNTSVAAKTRYLGVMRAVGMSGAQLDKMVLTEAVTYSLTGCIAGCILGVILQKVLIENWLTRFQVTWEFPLVQIILILIITFVVTAFSVIGPLKRIKARGIAEVVNSL